ncbi:MAG: (d)CMP kinase [Chitinophagales bacterium]|nr:(d)CMP kinase [Chitinophagales bacterium]MDW8427421.1 (d)CMP kinase [Chitinophagales bacterium]
MVKHIVIAIDGPSSSGKSTLARELAQALGLRYIDSGAYYRALTWFLMERRINLSDETGIEALLPQLNLEFRYNAATGQCAMFLNGRNVEDSIRQPAVSVRASEVSALPIVRKFITEVLRKAAENTDVVMDGRDIGTVVLPEATVKIFLTADEQVRLQRRLEQLQRQGMQIQEQEIAADLNRRDHQDSRRALAPLRQAPDAIVIDNSHLTRDQQRELVLNLIKEKLNLTNPIYEGNH